jgi:hypothetical protein
MKYSIAYLMVFISSLCHAQLTEYTSIPDTNFEKVLIYWGIDTDGVNGKVAKSNIINITKLIAVNKITDLTGIQDFVSLKTLDCGSNGFENLDLSHNIELTELICNYIKVPSIDLSNNKKLQKLEICCSALESLDLGNNEELIALDCSYNRLKSLDLNKNKKLEKLECYNNLNIPSLDLSSNPQLKEVYCSGNQIPSLDLSAQKHLTRLSCAGNPLKTLNVSENDSLLYLHCESDELSTIDLSNNVLLEELIINHNPFTSLDVSKNLNLGLLECSENHLTQLDVRNNPKLWGLAVWSSPSLEKICVEKDQYIITHTIKDSSARFVYNCDVVTAVDEMTYENQARLYPNPTEGMLQVENVKDENVDVYNEKWLSGPRFSQGRVVFC